jgi:CheY-like chemotaxis protein
VGKLKLVIADDQEDFRRLLVRFLDPQFNILDSVGHGVELVGSAILLNPDVIVSDISMPMLSGPQAMEDLHMRGLHIPFVFISAGENAVESGALFVKKEDVLQKLVPAIYIAASKRPPAVFSGSREQQEPAYRASIYNS